MSQDTRTDWVTVVPGRGETAATARALLALAGDPGDVRTQRGGQEFLVPPELADAYNKQQRPARGRRKERS